MALTTSDIVDSRGGRDTIASALLDQAGVDLNTVIANSVALEPFGDGGFMITWRGAAMITGRQAVVAIDQARMQRQAATQ